MSIQFTVGSRILLVKTCLLSSLQLPDMTRWPLLQHEGQVGGSWALGQLFKHATFPQVASLVGLRGQDLQKFHQTPSCFFIAMKLEATG